MTNSLIWLCLEDAVFTWILIQYHHATYNYTGKISTFLAYWWRINAAYVQKGYQEVWRFKSVRNPAPTMTPTRSESIIVRFLVLTPSSYCEAYYALDYTSSHLLWCNTTVVPEELLGLSLCSDGCVPLWPAWIWRPPTHVDVSARLNFSLLHLIWIVVPPWSAHILTICMAVERDCPDSSVSMSCSSLGSQLSHWCYISSTFGWIKIGYDVASCRMLTTASWSIALLL